MSSVRSTRTTKSVTIGNKRCTVKPTLTPVDKTA